MTNLPSDYQPSFRLVSDGSHHRVMDGPTQVMEIMNFEMFLSAQTILGGNVFRPGGPRRICNWVPFWEGWIPRGRETRVSVLEGQDSPRLKLLLQPDDRDGHAAVRSEITFGWDAALQSYTVEHEGWLTLRRAVTADDLGSLYPHPLVEGGRAWVWQMDDPNYENNYGPSVPMQQDWYHQYEPQTGPDTFRKHWRRGVSHLLAEDLAGTLRTIAAHRGRLWAQPLNFNLFPVKPGGRVGAQMTDGCGVIYEILTDGPAAAHICEWGFDHHYYQVLPEKNGLPDLPAGSVLHCHYRITEWSAEDMAGLLSTAQPLAPDPDMLAQVQFPAYEEPVNYFQTSQTDDAAADAWNWVPGCGATWDRTTGRTCPGSLRLEVASACEASAEWTMPYCGPGCFMNPFVPYSRYRLSGFVQVDNNGGHGPRATLGIAFRYHKGPGTYGVYLPLESHFSPYAPEIARGGWAPICVETPPINGYCSTAILTCRLEGRGVAWFDEVRLERID